MGAEALEKPVILLGQFTAGSGVDARWSDVAPQMQQAFARTLTKTGKFDVVYDRSIAKQSRTSFEITAKITDFLHTSDAPESVRRLHWFTEANDAIVAMDMTAMDLHTNRIVYSDQLVSTVSAGGDEVDQYGSLEFGSYLFWSTPLGRASTDVLEDAVDQLANLRGSTPGVVRITRYEDGSREVSLSDGHLLEDGGIYYIGSEDVVTGHFTSVDDDLGRPLRLRVEHHFFGSSSGWLLSEPADYEYIDGATLSKSPLPKRVTSQ